MKEQNKRKRDENETKRKIHEMSGKTYVIVSNRLFSL